MTGSVDNEADAESAEGRRSVLDELKSNPGATSLESVIAEIAKLDRLRSLELPADLFGNVSLKVVERFRQRAAAEAPNELRAHAPALRASLVAALCWMREREVTDSLVDLLIQVIHKIGVRAERRVEKELLDDFKRVTGKLTVLFHIAEASVEKPDGCVRDVVFPAAGGEQKLRDLVREYKSSGPAFRFQVHTYLRASYASHYRRMVPQVLQALEFRSNNATHQPLIEALELRVLEALTFLRTLEDQRKPNLAPAPRGVVNRAWRSLVVNDDDKIDRRAYTFCALERLQDALRRRDVYVAPSERWANPRAKLLQGANWEAARPEVCRAGSVG